MPRQAAPQIMSELRQHTLMMPEAIHSCSGIRIFGRTIRSLIFSSDVAIIRNCNADAVIAVYPFTPHPMITHALTTAADIPIFCGVGGGRTRGARVVSLAEDAEYQGAMGVVLNAPTPNSTLRAVSRVIDIPIVITVISSQTDIAARLDAGASILNVSGGPGTAQIVRRIREKHPDVPIVATGGPSNVTISETIQAGANAITVTPPSTAQLFRQIMDEYRQHPDEVTGSAL